MLRIGICDDSAEARQHMLQLCQKYYENNTDAFEYKMYKNAEEVLEYCDDEENQKIDILFLSLFEIIKFLFKVFNFIFWCWTHSTIW